MNFKNRLMYVLAGRKVPRENSMVKYRHPQKANLFREFSAGVVDRITNSFKGSSLSINESLKIHLERMRHRSRELVYDNDYGKKYINMVKTNVIGSKGIKLQARALGSDGLPDILDNEAIESAWADFGSMENYCVTGKLTMKDGDKLSVATAASDGEIFLRKVYGGKYKYGFAVQFIEADRLDSNLNQNEFNGGNRVVMSIEFDKFDVPVAYFILTRHPSTTGHYGGSATLLKTSGGGYAYGGKAYERIPASEIIHLFLPEWVQQARGVPWMHTSIRRLNMIGGYEEAELVSARVGASKGGFYTTETGEEYQGTDKESDGTIVQDLEPGSFEQLPANVKFTPYDPQHPSGSYNYFLKGTLRGASAGLNVSYNGFAGDLEGVNYSSIRAGLIEERENWKMLQEWYIEHCKKPIFNEWLKNALLRGLIVNKKGVTLPVSRKEKFMNVKWQARGWAWVDPLKDQNANDAAVKSGHTTNSAVVASKGDDLEEIYETLAWEKALAIKYGLDFSNEKVVKEDAVPKVDKGKQDDKKDDDKKDKKT